MINQSQAKQAKKYCPIAFDLTAKNAETFWKTNHFVDSNGNLVFPKTVQTRKGILCVIFPDDSIINY